MKIAIQRSWQVRAIDDLRTTKPRTLMVMAYPMAIVPYGGHRHPSLSKMEVKAMSRNRFFNPYIRDGTVS